MLKSCLQILKEFYDYPAFSGFLKEAASISESKVIQGRFVAERITQQKIKIPQEFEDVINSVAKLARVI